MTTTTTRIGDRLSAARHRGAVGREEELALLRAALDAAELPFSVLFLSGPGGVGKTTLLRAFASSCDASGIPVRAIDGRNLEPKPTAFLGALGEALGGGAASASPDDPLAALAAAASRERRLLLTIDTYETLEPLDAWVREVFVPQLPENVLVVLAGRQPPGAGWRADLGWQTMLRELPLRNLSPSESRRYLAQRAVPAEQHRAVLDFTHGYPLALSLVADLFAQRGSLGFEPEAAPDVIEVLLERFVQKVPGPLHRTALEISALVRLTTEPLLAEMLDIPDAADLFAWLRGLSFVESGWRGVFPHDVAREALLADLRWRSPDRYADLHRRARDYYAARLRETQGLEQQRLLFDCVFLHRDNAVVRWAFEWQDSTSSLIADGLRAEDHPALAAIVARHEGDESAAIAACWLAHPAQRTWVFRESGDPAAGAAAPAGFMTMVDLHEVRADDPTAAGDPGVHAALDFLRRRAPLRQGEGATLLRFWMARDAYQDVSPVQSLIAVYAMRHYLTTPGTAFTFFPCAQPELWEPVFDYVDLQRIPEADFEVGGKRYGTYGHDWRVVPTSAWLAHLAEKEVSAGGPVAPPPRNEPLVVLSEPDFARAVRDALKDFAQPDALRANPLLRSRVVLEGARGGETDQRIALLRARIQEAADLLQASPRRARGYRALYHTYLRPAPTQEQAADLLDLPFSTYRRHLAEGIRHLTELLWQREIGGLKK